MATWYYVAYTHTNINNMNNNIITIDLSKWTTQQDKANNTMKKDASGHVSIQYISKLMAQGKLKKLELKPLNLVLVEK